MGFFTENTNGHETDFFKSKGQIDDMNQHKKTRRLQQKSGVSRSQGQKLIYKRFYSQVGGWISTIFHYIFE